MEYWAIYKVLNWMTPMASLTPHISTLFAMNQFFRTTSFPYRANPTDNKSNDIKVYLIVDFFYLELVYIITNITANEYNQERSWLRSHPKWRHLDWRNYTLTAETAHSRLCWTRQRTFSWKYLWKELCQSHRWMP